MAKNRKYYVVWAGHDTGVFDSWEECKQQIANFPGAKFKGFDSRDEAIEAYRGRYEEYVGFYRGLASHKPRTVNYAAIPGIRPGAIAVDAACSGNPGPVEYQGVDIMTGTRLFHVGPLEGGSNNMGEFLAIVHALAWLDKRGLGDTPIYSDSISGMAWVRNRHAKTSIVPTAANAQIRELVRRAEVWLQTHTTGNPVLKWNTEEWGEIPADFGRK